MSGFRENRIGPVIDRLYEAAGRPELWRAVLDEYSVALGAGGTILMPGPQASLSIVNSQQVDGLVDIGVNKGWFADNTRVQRGIPALRDPKGVLVESDIFSPEDMNRIPFNADFVERSGFRSFAGLYLAPAGLGSLILSTERRVGQPPFSTDEIAIIRRMVPHIQRAGQFAIRLADTRTDAFVEAFDLIKTGCILLNGSGRAIRVNDQARARLGDGLTIVKGSLIANRPEANAALAKLIGSVLQRGPAHEAPPVGAVAIPQRDSGPLIIHAAPIVASVRDLFQAAQAIVLLTPREQAPPTESLLRQAYGLTPAEARIALAVAKARELAEIASGPGPGIETLRTQLKSVFAKTGARRQSELALMLAQLASPFSV